MRAEPQWPPNRRNRLWLSFSDSAPLPPGGQGQDDGYEAPGRFCQHLDFGGPPDLAYPRNEVTDFEFLRI